MSTGNNFLATTSAFPNAATQDSIMKNLLSLAIGLCLFLVRSHGFVPNYRDTCVCPFLRDHVLEQTYKSQVARSSLRFLYPQHSDHDKDRSDSTTPTALELLQRLRKSAAVPLLAVGIAATILTAPLPSMAATDSGSIVTCLFSKCQFPLLKCIANPKCLANVVCINTCNGREDEIGCQIKCGDLFDNEVVGEFNKCVVSDMGCVPQQKDEGLYPEPDPAVLVPKFDTKLWNGRWYITAGQNPLFDIL